MKVKVKLRNIASYAKGTQIKGDDLTTDGEYDYLNGGILPSGKWWESNTVANTVTISEGGNSCGYVNFMRTPFWCGAHCYYLYDTIDNTEYLYYALKSQQDRIMRLRSGACMPNIKKVDLGDFEFVCDMDEEQQKNVVSTLNKVARVIEYRKQELSALDDLVKAQFVEMFGVYPSNQRGWESGTIRDVVSDVRYGSSRPAVEGGAYPYLRMNNITYNGELDLTDIKHIDVPEGELEKCVVRRGDVLFNRTNSKELVGKTCVYNHDEVMVLAGFIIRVRVNDRMLPEFLSAFLNTDFSKRMLMGMCKTAIGQANINAQEMQNISIYIPPISIQEEFVQMKFQIDKSKLSFESYLMKHKVICRSDASIFWMIMMKNRVNATDQLKINSLHACSELTRIRLWILV